MFVRRLMRAIVAGAGCGVLGFVLNLFIRTHWSQVGGRWLSPEPPDQLQAFLLGTILGIAVAVLPGFRANQKTIERNSYHSSD